MYNDFNNKLNLPNDPSPPKKRSNSKGKKQSSYSAQEGQTKKSLERVAKQEELKRKAHNDLHSTSPPPLFDEIQ